MADAELSVSGHQGLGNEIKSHRGNQSGSDQSFIKRGHDILILAQFYEKGSQNGSYDRDRSQSQWINDLVRRRNANIAAVAVANKNARIAWALLMRKESYRAPA